MLIHSAADPTQFCSASAFVRGFLTLAAPDPALPLPAKRPSLSLSLLSVADLEQTILARSFTGFVETTQARRQKHRAAAGGWARPNQFRMADLRRPARAVGALALEKLSLAEVCAQLGEELRLGLRLARAGQLAYWRKDSAYEQRCQALRGGGPLWEACEQALIHALEAALHLCWHLRQRVGWWFAASCLRWQLRMIWTELFGPKVLPPDAVREWLGPLLITEEQECLSVSKLLEERRTKGALPAPWEAVAQRWEAGDLPEPLRPGAAPRLPDKRHGRLWL